jgi:hypothetical protein
MSSRLSLRRVAAAVVLPILAGCGGESSELPPPAMLPPVSPAAAASATSAPVASAPTPPMAPSAPKTLDPETAGPDEPLAGFAAVWADAPFFVDPRTDAAQIRLASFDGAPRRERLGHTIPVQIRGTQGDFVEVSAPPQEETPGFLPNGDAHCGWLDLEGPRDVTEATLFVRRSDLAPVLAAAYEQTFDDGSSVRLLPGTVVLRTDTGSLTSASTLQVPLSTKPAVRFAYPAAPPPLPARGESKHLLSKEEELTLGGHPFSLAGTLFAPVADHVDPVKGPGDRVLFPLASRCALLQISAPKTALRPYVPPALGRGGGVGFGVGGLGGVDHSVLPVGAELRTQNGRVIARVSREIDVDPKLDAPCIKMRFRVDSRYLGAPKLATTPAEVQACAAKSAVVKRKVHGGLGVGGLGTLGHGAGTDRGGGVGDGGGLGVFPGGSSVQVGAPQTTQGGLAPDQVRRVLSAHIGALRACYAKELQRDPKLHGRVTLKWQIDPRGTVPAASVASTTLGNSAVESCLVRQVRSWHFPAAQSPTVVNAYPLAFVANP